tara:strand:- start:279 stop:575 length:297 start_codon:yes stop_codon:yes gene_type:complete
VTKIDALLENYEKSKLEKVSVIHDNTVVAFVYVDKEKTDEDKLEEAFMLTNNIDCGWWENTNVEKMFDGKACRSTMVGDMVLIGTTKYKCDNAGWSKI